MVKDFSYTPATIAALEETISPDRLTSYLVETKGDKPQAFQLYAWNAATSAALYVPLQGLEVTLRNALHRQLTHRFGAQWYDQRTVRAILAPRSVARLEETKTAIRQPVTPSRLVAELSFGFWISLLGPGPKKRYEFQLWRSALRKAFPTPERLLRHVHEPLDYLRTLRNRIAHHEPIFGRHLQKDYERIIELIDWISPEKAVWVAHHSTVETTLADKPV